MPKWNCEIPSCDAPALRFLGSCPLCDRHICGKHLSSPDHDCPDPENGIEPWLEARRSSEERHLRALIERINLPALCHRATTLRHGVPCRASLPSSTESLVGLNFGGFNLHVEINFQDGVNWLARFRLLRINRPSTEKVNFDRMSEVATYRLLRNANIPVPRVFDYASDGDDNKVGAGYILFEKLPGHPMDWGNASAEQRDHIIEQMVGIYIKLETIQQTEIGRPVFKEGDCDEIVVGPAFFDYDTDGSCIPYGPFSTATNYYKAYVEHRRKLIDRGEIATTSPTDAALACKFLSDCVDSGLVHKDYDTGPYFLRHIDTRDVNFLVDSDFNVTGIIDWELAFVAPKQSAFQSPLFLFNFKHVYERQPSHEEEAFAQQFTKVGRRDLTELVRGGRKFFLFELSAATDPCNRDEFEEYLCGLMQSMDGRDEMVSWKRWKSNVEVGR